MSGNDNSRVDQPTENPKTTLPRFVLIGLLLLATIGVAVAAFQILRGDQAVKDFEISEKGVHISYYERHTTTSDGKVETITKVEALAVDVPGSGRIKLNDDDLLDLQSVLHGFNRFAPFIHQVLSKGETKHAFSVGDGNGMLLAWILSSKTPKCFQLMTLYTDERGRRALGSREACPDGDSWVLRVPPEIGKIFDTNAGPDFRTHLFLFTEAKNALSCLNGIAGQIASMTPLQVAVRCLIVGPMPNDQWITDIGVLKIGAELPYIDYFGYQWYKDGRNTEARRVFEALALFEDRCWTDQMIGATSVRLGRTQEAITEFSRALSRCPDDNASRINRATLYVQVGRIGEARRDISVLLAAGPTKVDEGTLAKARNLERTIGVR